MAVMDDEMIEKWQRDCWMMELRSSEMRASHYANLLGVKKRKVYKIGNNEFEVIVVEGKPDLPPCVLYNGNLTPLT